LIVDRKAHNFHLQSSSAELVKPHITANYSAEISTMSVPSGEATEWKKYDTYYISVDPNQDDKAEEIKMFSFKRPHMRAFHFSWMCFFTAFFIWFAIAPLMPEIALTLGLDKQQIWTSNICSVAGTIIMRFINGPLSDKYGARILMGIVLAGASIPCACTGLVQSASQLYVLRFFIGLGGSTFVMCQYWTSRMFTKEVAVSSIYVDIG
jgi:NNP family nitrate/nitrite transporter-like MFS transporter